MIINNKFDYLLEKTIQNRSTLINHLPPHTKFSMNYIQRNKNIAPPKPPV